MPAGSIVVDLLLKTGSFETDAKRAEKSLREFEAQTQKAAAAVGVALGAALTVSAVAFDQFVKGAAHFKDLEEVSGASAEGLASLAVAAGTAGTGVGAIADAVVQLAKNLTGVDDESKAAGAALAALNIPIEEFRKLDPVAQIDRLTSAFGAFADGPQKAAVAMALFGKSGAQLLPVFKALEQAGGRQTILTQQQIELADAYADAQAEATAKLQLYAQAAATQALPALSALTRELGSVFAAVADVDKATGQLRAESAVRAFAEDAVVALATVGEAVTGVIRLVRAIGGSFEAVIADVQALGTVAKIANPLSGGVSQLFFEENRRQISEAFERRNRTVQEANERYERLITDNGAAVSQALRKQFDQERAIRTDPELAREDQRFAQRARSTLPPRPQLRFEGARTRSAADRDDPTRRLLDNRLRELQAAGARERELLESRQRFLDTFQSQGLLSTRAYYDGQRAAIEEATAAQVQALDRQIDALRRFAAAQPKRTDRAEAEGRIGQLQEERARVERSAGERSIELTIRQQEEERRLAAEIRAVGAEVLELQGRLREAAEIRFDAQHFELVRRLTAEGNAEALRQVEALRRATLAQAEFARASTDAQRVQERLRNAEESINVARQLGASTELGALQQLGQARQGAVRELEAMVAAQEAIARASGSDALAENAARARIELEKLRATADPVADTFRSIFESGLGDAFADFITGAQSASEAFRSFADAVLRDIARLIAQDFAKRLFGAGGGLGDLGGAVARAFGFNEGGYTGNAGEREVAGVVHGGEYVFSAPAVRRIGVPVLERMHEGAKRGEAAVAGFAAGGHVGSAAVAGVVGGGAGAGSARGRGEVAIAGYAAGGYVASPTVARLLGAPARGGAGEAAIAGYAAGGYVASRAAARMLGAAGSSSAAASRALAGYAAGGYVAARAFASPRVPAAAAVHRAAIAGYANGGYVGAPRSRSAVATASLAAPGMAGGSGAGAGQQPGAAPPPRVLQQTLHFHLAGPVDRRSQEQIAAAVFRAAAVANRRNN